MDHEMSQVWQRRYTYEGRDNRIRQYGKNAASEVLGVLNTMSAAGDLMLKKDLSFAEVVSRVATPGGITEEGTKVIYEQLPATADAVFEKTLEKRKMTAGRAEELFCKEN